MADTYAQFRQQEFRKAGIMLLWAGSYPYVNYVTVMMAGYEGDPELGTQRIKEAFRLKMIAKGLA